MGGVPLDSFLLKPFPISLVIHSSRRELRVSCIASLFYVVTLHALFFIHFIMGTFSGDAPGVARSIVVGEV